MKFSDYKNVTLAIEYATRTNASKELIADLQATRRRVLEAIFDSEDEVEINKLTVYNEEFLNIQLKGDLK